MLSGQVRKKFHDNILSRLNADDIEVDNEELRCVVDGRPVVIETPFSRANAPRLEDRLHERSSQGIHSAVLFPRSTSEYDGNYLRENNYYRSKDENGRVVHLNTSVLSTSEQRLLNNFGFNDLSYYNASTNKFETFKFRKIPRDVVAYIANINTPLEDFPGDRQLLHDVDAMRDEYGDDYVDFVSVADKRRYDDLRYMQDVESRERAKLKQWESKGIGISLKSKRQRGLWVAKIQPYNPRKSVQLSMF